MPSAYFLAQPQFGPLCIVQADSLPCVHGACRSLHASCFKTFCHVLCFVVRAGDDLNRRVCTKFPGQLLYRLVAPCIPIRMVVCGGIITPRWYNSRAPCASSTEKYIKLQSGKLHIYKNQGDTTPQMVCDIIMCQVKAMKSVALNSFTSRDERSYVRTVVLYDVKVQAVTGARCSGTKSRARLTHVAPPTMLEWHSLPRTLPSPN